jgi:hypothetical protein
MSAALVRRMALASLAAAALSTAASCSTPEDGRVGVTGPPGPVAPQAWEVGNALLYTCGSLECHGSKYRNMRVYGFGGLRADPSMLPSGEGTTDAEFALTYRAVVGLEPEVMTNVTREKSGYDRLALVRKAKGLDNHKGGNRMPSGSAMEKCLLSWLGSATDVAACNAASLPTTVVTPAADAGADAKAGDGG